MKKIFILPILIAPIVAHATDPVGPAAASGTPVVATASAPYATATAENGDTTNVVSASYVKGAYNDAIAAVNKVANDVSDLNSFVNNDIEDEIADKQDRLINDSTDGYMSTNVQGVGSELVSMMDQERPRLSSEVFEILDNVSGGTGIDYDHALISAAATAKLMGTAIDVANIQVDTMINDKRVSAVTTWGSNTTTKVPLVNNN